MKKTLITLALLAGAATTSQAASVTLFSDDFDGNQTTAAGVTAAWSGVTTTGSSGALAGFSGNFLWNQSNQQASTLTLGGLSAYSSISVAFRLAFVDSWDSTNGSPAPDYFTASINGNGLVQLTCNNASGSICDNGPGTNASPFANVFNNGSWSELTRDVALSQAINAASASIAFAAAGSGWQAGNDESWAIDNLVVTGETRATNQVPEPGALALVGLALTGLALSRRRAR